MTHKKGFLQPQNTFLDTIATRFDGTHSNFVLGNAQATGFPIVYCSDGFCDLTGFARAQVMGKRCSCKFLYGPNTNEEEKDKIGNALDCIEELKTEILLYKNNKTTFWCLLDIIPIKNEKSQVVLFLVSHKDISNERSDSIDTHNKSDSESGSEDDYDENFRPPGIPRCRAEMPTNCNYQRRRSRAVLYHLSGQFENKNKAKSKLQKFNKQLTESISGKMPEYKVQEVRKSRWVLAHYGIFKIGWDWLILLCTFYTAIMVPYNAAFTSDIETRSSIYSDVVVEILFIIDIALNFRTSFVNKSGQIVYDGRQIALNYVKGWFLLDLLAAIPFDFLYHFNVNTNFPVHLLKLARLLRLARLLQKIDRYSQYSAVVIALLMLLFALVAHWLACIWYAIGSVELASSYSWTSGWIYELSERLDDPININKTNVPDLASSYVTALYFTCSSLTSVGFGNVSANTNIEKIFSVCAMLIGAMMHAVVFGNVTAIIQRMYARRQNYHSKTKDLKDFVRIHRIPKPLKHRMQEYFQTMWSMNNGMEASEILRDFPEELRGEIGLHLHKDLLSLSIFESATQGCLKSISLQTRRAFCAPGEYLLHRGDTVNYVYLLCSGSMEVLQQDVVVAILGKGDLFGTNIDTDDPICISSCDVRSLTYCELQGVSIKGLIDVLSLYPEFAEKFSNDIKHDLTYNLREGYCESDEEEYEIKPIGRVITLPSISEDDEKSDDTDDEESLQGGDNNNSTTFQKELSPSSPLLIDRNSKLPNGHPETLRDLTKKAQVKRVSSASAAFQRRSSLRERKRNLSTGSKGTEKLSGRDTTSRSLQNLRSEMEGTKLNICHIEKKVDNIGSELSLIDERLKSLIDLLTPNPSVHSGSPPLTPYSPGNFDARSSPYYVKPFFTFGSPTSEESVCDVSRGVPTDAPCLNSLDVPSSVRYSRKKPSSPKPRLTCPRPPMGPLRQAQRPRANRSYDNLLTANRVHDTLERRHSDGATPSKTGSHSAADSKSFLNDSISSVHERGTEHGCPSQQLLFRDDLQPSSDAQAGSVVLCDVSRRLRLTNNDVRNSDTRVTCGSRDGNMTVHTISTGDCRRVSSMPSRPPRNVVLHSPHLPSARSVLETTDL